MNYTDEDIESWVTVDDDVEPSLPDASTLNLDLASRMMGALRHLNHRVAEYAVLDEAERRRLDAAREKAIGPVVRRIRSIEQSLTDYAVKSFLDFDKTKLATPNGVISSNSTLPKLVVDDKEAGNYFENEDPSLVVWTPKILMGDLRKWLLKGEEDGTLIRQVLTDDPDSDQIGVIDAPSTKPYRTPFGPHDRGVWRIVGGGVYDTENGPEDRGPAYVPGVEWRPSGDGSVGRNFHITLS